MGQEEMCVGVCGGEVRGRKEKGKDGVGMTKAEQMAFLLFPFYD